MRSNTYTIGFTLVVTTVLAFFLSISNSALSERQELNIKIDIKKNILQSLEFYETKEEPWTLEIVQDIFNTYITSIVVNKDGNLIADKTAEQISDFENEFPIFIKKIKGKVDGYSIPISGKGLWSTLYGYFAIESDLMTAKGITFYKHKETPGLGGEVEKPWFQSNFKGKQFINSSGVLIGIQSIKGIVDETSSEAYHQVDGISGATMTTRGLNKFLLKDLKKYESYFNRVRNQGDV
jgi:Na+-transporting NADH:ubiquinone oxidoreductase subunit C